MDLAGRISDRAEARRVAGPLGLFNSLRFSGEDTGPSLVYRLHRRLVL
jgi:hypothetical protein